MTGIVKYPFGPADVQAIAYGAAMSADVQNQETQITIGQMTGAGTLDLVVDSEVAAGAELTIKVSADGTARALTIGDGFLGTAVTSITASHTWILWFKYMGGKFVLMSTKILD